MAKSSFGFIDTIIIRSENPLNGREGTGVHQLKVQRTLGARRRRIFPFLYSGGIQLIHCLTFPTWRDGGTKMPKLHAVSTAKRLDTWLRLIHGLKTSYRYSFVGYA
jgi:hypothetical protein